MSPDTLRWVLVGHVFGFVTWIGGLLACISLLHVHTRVGDDARAALTKVERSTAMLMDLGATLAIVTGLAMAIETHEFGHGAWLHVKLTAVVIGVLSVHGFVRVKVKKFRNGDLREVPAAVWLALVAGVLIAAILGANQTLLR